MSMSKTCLPMTAVASIVPSSVHWISGMVTFWTIHSLVISPFWMFLKQCPFVLCKLLKFLKFSNLATQDGNLVSQFRVFLFYFSKTFFKSFCSLCKKAGLLSKNWICGDTANEVNDFFPHLFLPLGFGLGAQPDLTEGREKITELVRQGP